MKKIYDITLIKWLGSGSFGDIYLSTKDGIKGKFATKQISRKEFDNTENIKYLRNEIQILKELEHPNICKYIDFKETLNNYYLVMEYINGGNLQDCLEKYEKKFKKYFPEEIIQYLMRQIISAFIYIHGKKIMHRDIKLENIMVNFNNDNDKENLNLLRATVKIIDFGTATKGFANSIVGTDLTMDPSRLTKYLKKLQNSQGYKICKLEKYDQKVDVWSLGAICYQMLTGKTIFYGSSYKELLEKVEEGNYSIPISVSTEIVSFLIAMLQYDSNKRLSVTELAEHQFLQKNIRDFHKIDIKKVSNKIDSKGLVVNIKNNQTIGCLFNEPDKNKLINIKGNEGKAQYRKAKTMDKQITSSISTNGYFHVDGNIYSFQPNNPNISNPHSTQTIPNLNNNIFQSVPIPDNSGPKFGQNNYDKFKYMDNMRDKQSQSMIMPQQPSALRISHTFPSRNNNFNPYQIFQGQGNSFNNNDNIRNQFNYGGNIRINDNPSSNNNLNIKYESKNRPMDNIEYEEKERKCCIM